MGSVNTPTQVHGFVPGDRVISRKGDLHAKVTCTECDRGEGKSDMITAEFIGGRFDGGTNRFYEDAWLFDEEA